MEKQSDLAECTFTPEISPYARNYVRKEPMSIRAQLVLKEREEKLKRLTEELTEKYKNFFTFKPTITNYQFRDKRENFLDPNNLSQQLQQKKIFQQECELKKLEMEAEHNTFQPQYSKQLERGEIPIHERLYRLANTMKKDETEKPNFTPKITPSPAATTNVYTKPREGRIDDNLYQDAKLREEKRLQQQTELEQKERELRSKRVLNKKSIELATQKRYKQLVEVYKKSCTDFQKGLNYEQTGNALQLLGFIKDTKRKTAPEIKILDAIWKNLDPQGTGYCSFDTFHKLLELILNPDEKDKIPKSIAALLPQLKANKFANQKIGTVKTDVEKEKNKELTFRPTIISDSPRQGKKTEHKRSPRYEILFRKKQETEEKIREKKRIEEAKKMKECTFKPTLIGFKFKESKRQSLVFDSLYNAKPQRGESLHSKTSEDKEMEECTFQPNITKTKNYLKIIQSSPRIPKGYTEAVERVRKAVKEREAHAEFHEQLRNKYNHYTYKNKKTIVQPFNFELDRRAKERQLWNFDNDQLFGAITLQYALDKKK